MMKGMSGGGAGGEGGAPGGMVSSLPLTPHSKAKFDTNPIR